MLCCRTICRNAGLDGKRADLREHDASGRRAGAALLVLPEALLARDDSDADLSVKSAQRLDGGFLRLLLAESENSALTTVLTPHIPSGEGRAANTLVALRQGRIIAQYQKLHLYDASISRSPGWSMPGGRFRRLSRWMGCASG